MKTTFQYNHYLLYEELKKNLEYFANTYPQLCQLTVNCVTVEKRNQYAVTLTNQKIGDALTKPGWYLDGNIHAGEVTSSMCAMHTIDYLLTNYDSDPTCKKMLDEQTIYVIPRVSPDGAEKYLSSAYMLRSAPRDYLNKEGGIKPQYLSMERVQRREGPISFGRKRYFRIGDFFFQVTIWYGDGRGNTGTPGTFHDGIQFASKNIFYPAFKSYFWDEFFQAKTSLRWL